MMHEIVTCIKGSSSAVDIGDKFGCSGFCRSAKRAIRKQICVRYRIDDSPKGEGEIDRDHHYFAVASN